MSQKVKEIEKEALQLDPHERALLAEHLIESLDADDDPEAERLWIESPFSAFAVGLMTIT